jgi:hypoxanthine phosphoribosyltransferase
MKEKILCFLPFSMVLSFLQLTFSERSQFHAGSHLLNLHLTPEQLQKNRLTNLIGLNEDINGKHVIIVEDIVDTGLTIDKLLMDLKHFNPASVRLACFTFKKDAFQKDFQIDYLGITIPDEFVVGYGLDYDGYGRNLPDIYKLID